MSLCTMRSTGAVVRPLAAGRSPTKERDVLATVCLGINVFALTFYYGKHSAYQLEFYCIHDTAVRFAL